MQKKYDTGLMWFRRDLRVDDNAALHQALKSCRQVFCLFVFDKAILDTLPRADRRTALGLTDTAADDKQEKTDG